MNLTEEQAQICGARGRVVRVIAYAGTGKTSTLVAWANAHRSWRTLYLAFNKSVQVEAAQRFPAHVTARTSHSLAYAAIGHRYRHKLGSLAPYQLERISVGARVPARWRSVYSRLVLDTLTAFWSSVEETLSSELVPMTASDQRLMGRVDPRLVAQDADLVWRRMQDPDDMAVKMTHDGYLKLYGLTRPRLPYDAILFDESQDANPVTLRLVTEQTHARLVLVGDPWQAIYGFRGAVNAMDMVEADQTFRLTGTFRFGPSIATVATKILQWRDPATPPLRGLLPDNPATSWDRGARVPETVICRTNAGLFEEAVNALKRDARTKLGFVGGIDGYQFDQLDQIYQIWAQRRSRDPFLTLFASFEQLRTYAKEVQDVALKIRCRIVKDYGHAIPPWIQKIYAASGPLDEADLILSTTHKAKGLEYDRVRLGTDFLNLDAEKRRWQEWQAMPPGPAREMLFEALAPQEELNLLYVAVTRAKRQLTLPPDIFYTLFPERAKKAAKDMRKSRTDPG